MTTPDEDPARALRRDAGRQRPAGARAHRGGLALGMEPQTLLFDALIPSLEEVGARFERGDFFVPEMLIAGRAMAGAMERLRPLLAETGVETVGKFLMGTVKGDVHDIGKNLVNIMLEGAGFEVIDLGVQVAPEKFVVGDRGAPARHRRLLGVPHHDHADVQGQHQRPREGRPARQGRRDGRRRTGHPGVRRRGRRRRLRRRRLRHGQAAPRTCSTSAAPRCRHDVTRSARAPGDQAPQRHQGGGDRPRPPLLHHRRAHQPDRPADLPGAAARRRPVGDRARRQGAGRGRRRRPRHQHGRAAHRRARAAGQGDPDGAEPHRPADLHRLLGRRGARGRALGLPGPRAGQLDHRRGRPDGGDPAAGQEVRRRDHRAAQRPRRDPDGGRQAPRPDREDHPRRHRGVRHRPGRHRHRPAGDADRRRHRHLAGDPRDACAGSATSSA